MEYLPDDVLLAVLGNLNNRHLLVCRVVCRRWCELVGHPDLWRHRTVSDLLLRLPPPCCHELVLSNGNLGRIGYLAATTACPATQLSITDLCVDEFEADYNFCHLGLAAIIIRQQANLGRLRKLSVLMRHQPDNQDALFDVYAVALGIESLQELEFANVEARYGVETSWSAKQLLLSAHPDWPVVQPSLQVLMMNNVALPVEVVEVLLRTHAPTLKKLNTGYVVFETDKLAGLVSSIPHLQELWCMPMEGLEQLLECHTLRILRIVIPTYSEYPETLAKRLSSARALLSSATQLTHVTFDYRLCNEDLEEEGDRSWGMDLVKSLGAAVASKLSSLDIDCTHYNELEPVLDHLLATVPHLPRLEKLVFGDLISADQLLELTRGAPSLTCLTVASLDVCLCCSWGKVCDILNASNLLRLTITTDCCQCTKQCVGCVVKPTKEVTFKSAKSFVKHVSKKRRSTK